MHGPQRDSEQITGRNKLFSKGHIACFTQTFLLKDVTYNVQQ